MRARTLAIQRMLLISFLVPALAAPGSAFARLTLEIGRTQGAAAYPQTNGRQVARSADGTWFVAFDGLAAGTRGVFVAASRKPDPALAGEFHPAAPMVRSLYDNAKKQLGAN